MENRKLKKMDFFKIVSDKLETRKIHDVDLNRDTQVPESYNQDYIQNSVIFDHQEDPNDFKRLLLADSSDEDNSEDVINVAKANFNEDETEKPDENENCEDLYSNLIESDDFVSAIAGTSRKSSNSFRHVKQLVRIQSAILSDNESVEDKSKIKSKSKLDYTNENMYGSDLEVYGSDESTNDEAHSDDLNIGDTLTVVEDQQPNLDILHDEENKYQPAKLKRTVFTILLTQKWGSSKKDQSRRKRKKKAPIRYLPTFRIEPTIDLNVSKYLIINKTKQTFESLIEKHGKYDIEYTPRFLRIVTEMIKNDVRSFKLDRYKIVVYVSIVKRVMHQSIQFISKELLHSENDHKICLKVDTKSFYAVCLIFLVYHE